MNLEPHLSMIEEEVEDGMFTDRSTTPRSIIEIIHGQETEEYEDEFNDIPWTPSPNTLLRNKLLNDTGKVPIMLHPQDYQQAVVSPKPPEPRRYSRNIQQFHHFVEDHRVLSNTGHLPYIPRQERYSCSEQRDDLYDYDKQFSKVGRPPVSRTYAIPFDERALQETISTNPHHTVNITINTTTKSSLDELDDILGEYCPTGSNVVTPSRDLVHSKSLVDSEDEETQESTTDEEGIEYTDEEYTDTEQDTRITCSYSSSSCSEDEYYLSYGFSNSHELEENDHGRKSQQRLPLVSEVMDNITGAMSSLLAPP